jgi:hypothetical protein
MVPEPGPCRESILASPFPPFPVLGGSFHQDRTGCLLITNQPQPTALGTSLPSHRRRFR